MEESLSMARKAFEDGIRTIVATPHTLDGLYTNSLKVVSMGVAGLQDALASEKIDLRVCVGADVHLCPRITERIEKGDATTINNAGKYLLLELPSQTIPAGVKDEIFSLRLNGITPIITHPERHPVIQRDMNALHELISLGALGQVTAMSLTGDFGGMVMACAEVMLAHRLVHLIASDAHSPDHRPPVLSPAVEAAAEILGSNEEAERMVTGGPALILAGDPFEGPPPTRVNRHYPFVMGH
jgi:protein-tyrosine phosphatase